MNRGTSKRKYTIQDTPKTITIRGVTYYEHQSSIEARQHATHKKPETLYAMPGRVGAFSRAAIVDLVNATR